MIAILQAQVGMGSFMSNMDGSGGGGGGGGGTGVPIDGGIITMIIGSAGYAYKKIKQSKGLDN